MTVKTSRLLDSQLLPSDLESCSSAACPGRLLSDGEWACGGLHGAEALHCSPKGFAQSIQYSPLTAATSNL